MMLFTSGFDKNSHNVVVESSHRTMPRGGFVVALRLLIWRIVCSLVLRPPLRLLRPLYSPCRRCVPALLRATPEQQDDETANAMPLRNEESLSLLEQTGTVSILLELKTHKPMGCTVEESLADGSILFVSSVVPGGNAEMAGLRVGDVVSGITGLFGMVESTQGMDLGILRTLVESRSAAEPLLLRVVRGSTALADHERALTDICSNPDGLNDKVEYYISTFLKDGYDEDTSSVDEDHSCNVDDQDCLIDEMCNLWAADLTAVSTGSVSAETETKKDDMPKVKPWSVRSSPSGTYVRDPTTGQMKNIG